ncbi:lysine--tRNA ligase [Halobacteriales archaeon Cl-PHB]
MAEPDPYTVTDSVDRAFWADAVADAIEDRDPDEPIVVKGGISPSGVPHLGNVNEIMRGYFVAEALRDRGHEVRQVFTTDDRDPLRKVPRKLADLDGNIVGLGEVDAGALGRNLGKPYTDVPDPFGCCDSYGDHFSHLIERSADLLGVPIDVVSVTDLYEDGDLDEAVRFLLDNRETAREVLADYQAKVDDSYVPFNPICEDCGKITETVTAVDADAGTVDYVCTDMEAGEQTIEGCGHEGTAGLRDGKLPWRFEWPAEWQVLGVDFEPFGKDHAEGSWPSGEDVARTVFEMQPPVPMVYEWFTLNGDPFSSSAGNVILVSDVLELLEPEAVRYFFSLDPSKARDFDVGRLDQLVDDFDRFERVYYGDADADESERAVADAAYPLCVLPSDVPTAVEGIGAPSGFDANDESHREARRTFLEEIYADRVRFPYTFAAVLGMFPDREVREGHARKQGHLPEDAPEWAIEDAFDRVALAKEWAHRTSNEYDYTIAQDLPEVAVDSDTAAGLDDLADFVAEGHDGEEIQGAIYESAKRHGVDVGDFFAAGYRLFFDAEEGPQLGPFLGKLEREFVVDRLRREA